MICKICSSNAEAFSKAEILNKYSIQYFKCPECGFIQTEEPYWLEEAYSEVINRSDIGLLARNLDLSRITRAVLKFVFKPGGKYIDYGAGYGVFVRLMRDYGFDFYWTDKYSDNLFAKDFEADLTQKYEVLTAYEVFEHLVNPCEELEIMLKYSDNILFSTFLIPANNPKPGEWWYYATDHGQHIALYSRKSLEKLGKKFNLNFYSNGKNIHLFSRKAKNDFLFRVITFPYAAKIISPLLGKKSLLDEDYKMILYKLKSNH